jgi:hypothetical protein
MLKDPICEMMVDEKTSKHASEIEGERESIYALQTAKASSMPAKRVTTTAAIAVVTQTDMATESPQNMAH